MAFSDGADPANYYDRDAAGFAARYDSITFAAAHPLLSRYLPARGAALDIGAGSGRDARALTAHGLDVTAVEPSAGLRAIGAASDARVRWIDDRLPNLASLADEPGRFDLILCSAVLMLIPSADLSTSFATLARLLAPTGRLLVNVRQPMPDEPRNMFFSHLDEEISLYAAAAGLSCLERAETADALGRTLYSWHNFIYERASC